VAGVEQVVGLQRTGPTGSLSVPRHGRYRYETFLGIVDTVPALLLCVVMVCAPPPGVCPPDISKMLTMQPTNSNNYAQANGIIGPSHTARHPPSPQALGTRAARRRTCRRI
jgi:hypothetical protein